MKIHYVVNARLPNQKAYGIQIAKMCEAFIESGVEVQLIVPSTRMARSASMKSFYTLRVEIPVTILPCVDWYEYGRFGFYASSLMFMTVSFAYLLLEKMRGRLSFVYAIDTDSFSFVFLPLLGVSCVAEMHESKQASFFMHRFFSRVALVVATNAEIAMSLKQRFYIAEDKITVEPNGVDIQEYGSVPSKADARKQLGLSADEKIALYAGRFYSWKGLEIITEAARQTPTVGWHLIGGDEYTFEKATGERNIPSNVHMHGDKPLREVPLWLAAADVLLIIGTTRNERSYRFTSPMKLYEYMAAGRPVVASATPALKSIVPSDMVHWYIPDTASDLVRAVSEALATGTFMTEVARAEAQRHAWISRAGRIRSFLEHSL